MPPKAKFTKEQIIKEALSLVREEGTEVLTARALAKKLNSSVCPIFTVFESMEEIQREVVKAAKKVYAGYVARGLRETPAFKGVGMQYIAFAKEEPQLFQLLFLSGQSEQIEQSFPAAIDDNSPAILQSVIDSYSLSEADAKRLYLHLSVYSHGIASLCARRVCFYPEEEISRMLTEVFVGLLKEIKRGERK